MASLQASDNGIHVKTTNNENNIEEKLNNLKINNENHNNHNDENSTEKKDNHELDGMSQGLAPSGASSMNYIQTLSEKNDEVYSMSHKKRGHCLIFNHKIFSSSLNLGERNGTDVDRDRLQYLFQSLQFDVHVFNNLAVKDIKQKLEEYTYEIDHSDCDCFAVVFMSHGEDGHLYGYNSMFKADVLYQSFSADNCKSLAGKPKLFFVQACRGDGLDSGTQLLHRKPDQTDSGSLPVYKIPNQADFLVCFSTVPGHYSWRNTTNGSWFVQSLSYVFSRYANKQDVASMLTAVNRHMILNFESNCPSSVDMHGKKQTACVMSTLMRQVFFLRKS